MRCEATQLVGSAKRSCPRIPHSEHPWINEELSDTTSWDQLREAVRGFSLVGTENKLFFRFWELPNQTFTHIWEDPNEILKIDTLSPVISTTS